MCNFGLNNLSIISQIKQKSYSNILNIITLYGQENSMQNENEALIVFHNLSFVFTPSHAMMPDWDFYLISF